jgi:hypothetical protein
MRAADKKAAKAAYKELDVAAGIYAVRCTASGKVWVGHAPNIDKIQNRVWFTLNHGSHRSRSLQAAWQTHASETFAFEVLERLEDEELDYVRATQLKERAAHWCAQLKAEPI